MLFKVKVSGLEILPDVRTGRTNNGTHFFFDIHLDKGDNDKGPNSF